jgi:carboxypeptidase T
MPPMGTPLDHTRRDPTARSPRTRRAATLLAAGLAWASLGPVGAVATGTAATLPAATTLAGTAAHDFPRGDTGYHTYAEIAAEVRAVAAAHPDIVRRFSIGSTWQGRALWTVEVTSADLPERDKVGVLFDGGTHGNEHLGPEATLALFHWLVDGYGTDSLVTRLVRTRSIFIVFEVNPDGSEYDISGGRYHQWRRNRQPTPGTSAIGTDINRNYGYRWGCCGKVSRNPASGFYRGPVAWSTREARAMRALVASRVIDGRQQIRGYVSFHTAGRLILWPYGYTRTARTKDMSADDHAAIVAVAKGMAARNGYRAMQGSSLYVDSGTSRDWAYGAWKMFAYTVELGIWNYPSDEKIAPEMKRSRGALLWFIDQMGCPYDLIGKAARYCP